MVKNAKCLWVMLTGVIWSFVLFPEVQAQTFLKSLGNPLIDDGGNAMTATPDGAFVIGGYCGDSALVMKVDGIGAVLWSRSFDAHPSYRDVVWQLTISPDNHIIGVGNSVGGSPSMTRALFIFKIDLDGNISWVKRSSDANTWPHYTRAILPMSSSEYVLVNDIYEDSGPTYADPILQGVNASTGSVMWTSPRYDYVPGQSYLDDVYAGAMGYGGAVYTTGRSYLSGSDGGSMRPYISKFTGTGSHLWTKYYVAPVSQQARVYGIDIIHEDDSLTMCYFGDIQQYSPDFKIGLIHTDTLGVFAWGKDYDLGAFGTELSYKVLRMPYGYAIVGYGSGASHDLFAIGVSVHGNLLWAKGYGDPAVDEDLESTVSKMAVASGNDLLFTARKTIGGQRDVLLVRVDSTGEMACGGSYDLSVGVSDVEPFSEGLFPQASSNVIELQSSSLIHPYAITDPCDAPGSFLGPDTAICAPFTLNASIANGDSYLWQDGSTDPTLTITTAGSYWVLVTIGCCTIGDTVEVTSSEGPTAAFEIFLDSCAGSITIENSSDFATSYYWTFGDSATSTSEEPVHAYAGAGTYTITLVITNDCGADSVSHTIQVPLPQPPTASFTYVQDSCTTLVNFTDGSSQAQSWYWDFGNGETSTAQNPSIAFAQEGSYTVQLIVASSCGSDTLTQLVALGTQGALTLTGPSHLCAAGHAVYTAVLIGDGISQTLWSTGDTTLSIEIDVDTDLILSAWVQGSNGCAYSDSLAIHVIGFDGEAAAFVPNVFTPNDDGINEFFAPVIIDGFRELTIFNRWGQEIYHTTDIHEPWNGTYQGLDVPDGTYLYIAKWRDHCRNVTEERHGHVTVLR